jgi:hypothetical protein
VKNYLDQFKRYQSTKVDDLFSNLARQPSLLERRNNTMKSQSTMSRILSLNFNPNPKDNDDFSRDDEGHEKFEQEMDNSLLKIDRTPPICKYTNYSNELIAFGEDNGDNSKNNKSAKSVNLHCRSFEPTKISKSTLGKRGGNESNNRLLKALTL